MWLLPIPADDGVFLPTSSSFSFFRLPSVSTFRRQQMQSFVDISRFNLWPSFFPYYFISRPSQRLDFFHLRSCVGRHRFAGIRKTLCTRAQDGFFFPSFRVRHHRRIKNLLNCLKSRRKNVIWKRSRTTPSFHFWLKIYMSSCTTHTHRYILLFHGNRMKRQARSHISSPPSARANFCWHLIISLFSRVVDIFQTVSTRLRLVTESILFLFWFEILISNCSFWFL